MRKILTIQQIIKADDLISEEIHVPEWALTPAERADTYVRVRSLTGTQRDLFESSLVTRDGKKPKADTRNVRAKLVAMCLVDEHDNPQDASEAAVIALGRKSAAALDRVFTACQRLAGLSAADVEELEKKSAPDLNGSLLSTSAPSLDVPTLTNFSGN